MKDIIAKMDPISTTAIKEKGIESIVDWFNQHIQSFYTLGWSYLRTQQQMEELFYRAILQVKKEWPRFKGKTPFEMWVTTIFIHNCRELSSDKSLLASEESEPRQDLFKALDQLHQDEKEAIVLTYLQGFSQEEAAQLLEVSAEKMKDLLFSGIRSLRNEMSPGSIFNGCKEYQKDYIDYLERAMERPEKIDFEIHIYHCQDCQEDLAAFQDVMLMMLDQTNKMADLHVPSRLMENIRGRLAEIEKRRQQKNKKRKKVGLVFAGVFAMLIGIGFFTGAFSYLYYSWTEEDLELRSFLQQDLGDRLNLVAESNGVKVKIKSIIADDVQTLVYYEIEDTGGDNQYMMNYGDGLFVENDYEIMSRGVYPRYYPPDLESEINKKEKNVFHGKTSLLPLKEDKGTIKLNITRLQQLIRDSSDQYGAGGIENKTGEWNFEIPVTKQPTAEYALDAETDIEGVPVRLDKLIIAPTATVMQFSINNGQRMKRIDNLNFKMLEVNNKKVNAFMYGNYFVNSQTDINWHTYQTHFDPIFGEKPKDVNIQFESAYLTVEDKKTIELGNVQDYPHLFEYAGSTISIDKKEDPQSTNFVISNHEVKDREYEWLQFNIFSESNSMEMNSEGVIVDKNGVKYDMNAMPIPFEKIEQPRHFATAQSVRFQGNNVNPQRLEIFGYSTTKYLDEVVKISVK